MSYIGAGAYLTVPVQSQGTAHRIARPADRVQTFKAPVLGSQVGDCRLSGLSCMPCTVQSAWPAGRTASSRMAYMS